VGKSTFAGVLMQDRPGRLVTLDDPGVLAAARMDPVGFVEQAPAQTLVIDEIQRAPELILALKAAIDRDRTPGRFIVTGSADLLRLERSPDSLAGRAVSIDLYGLSQGEIHQRGDDFAARVLAEEGRPGSQSYGADRPPPNSSELSSSLTRAELVAVLAKGGYPQMHRLDGSLGRTWLDSYLSRVVQRDAADVRSVQPDRLRSVLRLMAANQAGELVKARLAQQAGLPATTLSTYLDVVQALHLVRLVPSWTPNLTRREIARPKALVLDSALALRLARLTPPQLEAITGADHLGGVLEGFVGSELIKQQGWTRAPYEVHHYRDRDGREVDLVLELEDGRVIGIEVKATQTPRADHFIGLRAFADRLGDRFVGGYVVGLSASAQRFGDRLWSIPVAELWQGGQ
jgi:predicted AAA+ superfamily ATPase